jgi:mannose-6-phosphate isomerase-like protein (cupin superfamily)
MTPLSTRVTLAEAMDRLTPSSRSHAMLLTGSVEIKIYAPRGIDPQTPHTRDELYIVMRGAGWFVNGPERHPFGPGDVLFVPAGVEHRFEEFTEDFATWVVFYGPEGGESES